GEQAVPVLLFETTVDPCMDIYAECSPDFLTNGQPEAARARLRRPVPAPRSDSSPSPDCKARRAAHRSKAAPAQPRESLTFSPSDRNYSVFTYWLISQTTSRVLPTRRDPPPGLHISLP